MSLKKSKEDTIVKFMINTHVEGGCYAKFALVDIGTNTYFGVIIF